MIHTHDFTYPNYDFTGSFDVLTAARQVRKVVNGCLEKKRSDKVIGASLEAKPMIYIENPEVLAMVKKLNFADLCIVGEVIFTDEKPIDDAFMLDDVAGVCVVFDMAQGEKCERCWKILPQVTESKNHLCKRCDDAISNTL
jgi:isoleucyl-tRNA synthetase